MYRPAGESDEYNSDYDDDFEDLQQDTFTNRRTRITELPVYSRLENAIKNDSLKDVQDIVATVDDLSSLRLNGWPVITFAVHYGDPNIVSYLMRFQPPTALKDAYTPLMAACNPPHNDTNSGTNRERCIKLLLVAGMQINFKDRYGVNALMLASKAKQVAIVRFLLVNGAEVNEYDNDGWSPLFYAVNANDIPTVKVLLEYKADINKVDKRKRKPFHIALEKEFSEVAELVKPESEKKVEQEIEEEFFVRQPKNDSFEMLEPNFHFEDTVLDMVDGSGIDMYRYIKPFALRNLPLREFLLLKSEFSLKEIGVGFSMHRYILLSRIKQFHMLEWSVESFGLIDETKDTRPFQLLKALNFLATLFRQLYTLRTTFQYIKDDISRFPEQKSEFATRLVNIKKELRQLQDRISYIYYTSKIIDVQTHPYLFAMKITDKCPF